MNKDDLTSWALENGWRMIAGSPSLKKSSSPKEAVVRMVLKATIVTLEVKRPAGKWEKVSGQSYDPSLTPIAGILSDISMLRARDGVLAPHLRRDGGMIRWRRRERLRGCWAAMPPLRPGMPFQPRRSLACAG